MKEKATQTLKSKKLGKQWLEIPFPASAHAHYVYSRLAI